MKITALLALTFVVLLSQIVIGQENVTEPLSANDAFKLGMDMYYEFMNETGESGYYLGCCPCIIPCGRKGSVIQPFTGYRGNAAIIVDWGYACEPRAPWKRACTLEDKGFIWFVDWGDGKFSHNSSTTIGPFQEAHQYKSYKASYGVKAVYCSNPKFGHRCCDSLYRVIDVSFDPQHPYPEIFGN